MTHEQLARIGTLFYSTKYKGTGLGTTVSLRIIETMNGKVTYQSKPGFGFKGNNDSSCREKSDMECLNWEWI
ncbi:ATP-binding protein [Neobacillus soli]|uniref:ATP-binding protein n=1 Tax=Neobacillus soli TaxID=220688 RepID=UPI000826E2B4|nr:ATP-binding protein [Neobacillus soli]